MDMIHIIHYYIKYVTAAIINTIGKTGQLRRGDNTL